MKTQVKYMAIDAHSSTCSFCVVDAQGTEIDQRSIATNGRLLIDYVQSFGKDVVVAFEECDLSCWLFDLLRKHVRELIVCHPAANAEYKRAKTDKLDALRLAQLLRGGFLHPVFHDGSEREKLRILVSNYDDCVRDIVRMKNRLKAINRRKGLSKDKTFINHMSFVKERLTFQLEPLIQTRDIYHKKLEASVRRFEETKYLISAPGIKYIQAARIIAQVVDPLRFKNKYKFFAYCALVRHPRISNKRFYGTTHIWGNRTLKCVFKMAAHSALRGDNALKTYYESLRLKGISDQNARNAVARKIAALTLSLWRNKQRFNEQKFLERLPAKV
jgi:transposase